MPLRKELKRGLVALAVLVCIGTVALAAVASSSAVRSYARSGLASRLEQRR
jgi:hypothetical protein